MIAQFFILLGYLFRQYQDRLANLKKTSLLLLSFGYVLMGLVSLKLWPGSCIDVHMNIYYNYPLCFLMITLGGLTLFSAGKAIFEKGQNSLPRFVLFAGQNTIVFYLLHSFNIAALAKMLSLLHIRIPFYPFAIIKTAFALFTCSIESLILIRFFPWVIGRGSTKTKNKGSIMK